MSQGPAQFKMVWIDSGREARSQSDPDYPDGVDIDISAGRKPFCYLKLPYPAKRVGVYTIDCRMCGLTVACTTAGRPDDPKSLTVACSGKRQDPPPPDPAA